MLRALRACRHPPVLGSMVKRGAQPGAGTQQFALLFAYRILWNLGVPIHCFGQLIRAIFLRSSLTTTTANAQNAAPSTFNGSRGRASYGVVPKLRAPCTRCYVPQLMHTPADLKPNPKKNKKGPRKKLSTTSVNSTLRA